MKTLTPGEAQTLLERHEAILIDVREPDEFAREHIQHARSIPLDRLKDTLRQWQAEGNKTVIFQCQKGARGEMACQIAAELNKLDNISNLEGGINSWKAAGFEVIGTDRTASTLPLMRQVQIVFGVAVLILSLLSYMDMSLALPVLALLGAGMLLSGLTGWCGLALLLRKMPWNH